MVDYEMYTEEGNKACQCIIDTVREMSKNHERVYNRKTLAELAYNIHEMYLEKYPEMGDTEPRAHISDELDKICDENGWAYNKWDSYF